MNEQALKARLKHIGKEKSKSSNEVWKLLVLERLLARLSRSEYSDKFIFKGVLGLGSDLALCSHCVDL
ncbi:hypothetical protein SC610_12425 [Legionella pneumophila serogroup 1]